MSKPTHFVLNNEDLIFSVTKVGTFNGCKKFVEATLKDDQEDDPYSSITVEEIGVPTGARVMRYSTYTGTMWVVPIGVDMTGDWGDCPNIVSEFNLKGFEREEEGE
jgi:hypothetical protein